MFTRIAVFRTRREPRRPREPSLAVKTLTIGDAPVLVYSYDGRLWCSRPSDFQLFEQRRLDGERIVRQMLSLYVPAKL